MSLVYLLGDYFDKKVLLIKVVELRNGYGRHVYVIPPQDLEEKMIAFLKVLWVFNLWIGISIVLSKLAMYVLLCLSPYRRHYLKDRERH